MKDLSLKSTINNIDPQKSHKKFDDRFKRGKDYAFLGVNNILEKFDGIYSKDRPGFIEGYKKLKESITGW